ncbi:uncharacterized protein LOC126681962 [Mercurialis annua]|uniref:uncharacterized protein LOC126681962 n=1 Tax=Mercurialis annua TaxID=3986 RepID=UPI00215EA372|nr:uncharacterized protein LOC126681962 [Mercurialis annua]
MFNCGLKDVGAMGYKFTWHRGRNEVGRIEERLDRALCSTEWIELFPDAIVENNASGPTIKQFRFSNVWLAKKKCVEVVDSAWSSNPVRNIADKLVGVKEALMYWGCKQGPNFKNRIEGLRKQMSSLQQFTDNSRLMEYNNLFQEYQDLLKEEETY